MRKHVKISRRNYVVIGNPFVEAFFPFLVFCQFADNRISQRCAGYDPVFRVVIGDSLEPAEAHNETEISLRLLLAQVNSFLQQNEAFAKLDEFVVGILSHTTNCAGRRWCAAVQGLKVVVK